jgi:hypothetical protein
MKIEKQSSFPYQLLRSVQVQSKLFKLSATSLPLLDFLNSPDAFSLFSPPILPQNHNLIDFPPLTLSTKRTQFSQIARQFSGNLRLNFQPVKASKANSREWK